MQELSLLISKIGETQNFFKNQAQRQVNVALTLRNWLIGFYISEYELNGNDRAEYGKNLYKEIEKRLKKSGVEQIRERHLYICRDFFKIYPEILRSPSAKLYLTENQQIEILLTLSAESENNDIDTENHWINDSNKLINQLSFSHIVEFLKLDNSTKRAFYETEAIKNNWSVRELQRAVNSMLFERTGLSKYKQKVLDEHQKLEKPQPEIFFFFFYIKNFLGIKEGTSYTEDLLLLIIIKNLKTFPLPLLY